MSNNEKQMTALTEEANYIVNANDLIDELKIILDDYFTCAASKGDSSLELEFTNGQKFLLTVSRNT